MVQGEINPTAEQVVSDLFQSSVSGSGEEELLKTASTYSRQFSARQIRLLLIIETIAIQLQAARPRVAAALCNFVKNWVDYKQYNNSSPFVMRALDSIALSKFLKADAFRVNIDKRG